MGYKLKNKKLRPKTTRTPLHYNKSDFFQGSKPLKKVLKNLEKNYFKSPIDP